MLSDFRNRLRQQAGKLASAEVVALPVEGADCTSVLMAWEASVPDVVYETRTKLSSMEAEWREKIYQQLLRPGGALYLKHAVNRRISHKTGYGKGQAGQDYAVAHHAEAAAAFPEGLGRKQHILVVIAHHHKIV